MLVGRGMDIQQIAIRAGFEQADAPLGRADQIVLGALHLEIIHVELPVYLAAMEEELKKFRPSPEIDQVEDNVYKNNLADVTDLLDEMLKEIKNRQ